MILCSAKIQDPHRAIFGGNREIFHTGREGRIETRLSSILMRREGATGLHHAEIPEHREILCRETEEEIEMMRLQWDMRGWHWSNEVMEILLVIEERRTA